ncbi:MAG: DUF2163 domain-containing protein [Amaricoccus sp.]
MRKIDPEFQARLDGRATQMCRCWRVQRADGVELGFTDHDRDLTFDGLVFRANTGLDASALQTTTGLSVDNGQAVGALSDAAVTEEDIRAGKFDRAEVHQWLVDWTQPELRVLLFRGWFGEIRRSDGKFEVELRGLAEALGTTVGRSILRSCDRVLGDERCGFDLAQAGFSVETSVQAGSDGARIVTAGFGEFSEGWFTNGHLVWLSGGNLGERAIVKSDVLSGEGARIVALWREPARPLSVGDRFRLLAGCDKQMSTCKSKFSNLLNFRGFPHIPGEDWVAAYPKDGANHDGGSTQ